MAFAISSTGFENGGDIPRKFTCDGADVSPELSWTEPPPGTESFTLIADDPDAPSGTWTHWVLFDLPAATTSLAEGVTKIDELPGGERQGRNDFRKIGYNGPCPPPGKPHRYFFKLYALKGKLDLKPGASRQEVEQAMQGLVLGQAEWMGKYHHSQNQAPQALLGRGSLGADRSQMKNPAQAEVGRGTSRLTAPGGARQVGVRGALHAVPAVRFGAIECRVGRSQKLLTIEDRIAKRIPGHRPDAERHGNGSGVGFNRLFRYARPHSFCADRQVRR